eukprot:756435-Lingulodinium_polyedra.AAC.1
MAPCVVCRVSYAAPLRAVERACSCDRPICEWISRSVRLYNVSPMCDLDPDHWSAVGRLVSVAIGSNR